MIRIPVSVTHGSFHPRPDIALVLHPSFVSVKRLYDTATRDNGLFCGTDPQRHEIHLWCVLDRVSVDEVVAEIGEALAMLLFLNGACVIEVVAWVAKQSFLWGMQVVSTKKRNRIIRKQAVDAVKEHRLNLLKERHARQLRQLERVTP